MLLVATLRSLAPLIGAGMKELALISISAPASFAADGNEASPPVSRRTHTSGHCIRLPHAWKLTSRYIASLSSVLQTTAAEQQQLLPGFRADRNKVRAAAAAGALLSC